MLDQPILREVGTAHKVINRRHHTTRQIELRQLGYEFLLGELLVPLNLFDGVEDFGLGGATEICDAFVQDCAVVLGFCVEGGLELAVVGVAG